MEEGGEDQGDDGHQVLEVSGEGATGEAGRVKVAVLGGTGRIGGAIARQLAKENKVIIGSRDPRRADEAARGLSGAKGSDHLGAAEDCDVAVVTVPYSALGSLSGLAEALSGKLAISTV